MSLLKISYVRGGAITNSTKVLSVEIDGARVGEISDNSEQSWELTEGRHEVIVRSGQRKKIIEIFMNTDDSFIVTWDWVLGGLMVCDKAKTRYNTGKRSYYWFYVLLGIIIVIHAVNFCLYVEGCYSRDVFTMNAMLYAAAIVVLFIPVIVIRMKKVTRSSGVDEK